MRVGKVEQSYPEFFAANILVFLVGCFPHFLGVKVVDKSPAP